jgi:hypothetical protein
VAASLSPRCSISCVAAALLGSGPYPTTLRSIDLSGNPGGIARVGSLPYYAEIDRSPAAYHMPVLYRNLW